VPGGGHPQAAVQRAPAIPSTPAASAGDRGPEVTPPVAGIDKPGFIDNSDGSNIRRSPGGGTYAQRAAATGVTRVRERHASQRPEWWYVTPTSTMRWCYVSTVRSSPTYPSRWPSSTRW
jgi:hypothetical protein